MSAIWSTGRFETSSDPGRAGPGMAKQGLQACALGQEQYHVGAARRDDFRFGTPGRWLWMSDSSPHKYGKHGQVETIMKPLRAPDDLASLRFADRARLREAMFLVASPPRQGSVYDSPLLCACLRGRPSRTPRPLQERLCPGVRHRDLVGSRRAASVRSPLARLRGVRGETIHLGEHLGRHGRVEPGLGVDGSMSNNGAL